MPGWNEPVATGTLSPIFNDAFWPSTARICGFWISFVLLSENRALMVAGEIVTWKSVAFRLPSAFRLMELELVLLVLSVLVLFVLVLLLLLLLFVVVTLGCNCTVMLVGGLMPSVRFLSRLICITATSTTTSDLDLSRSLTNFCASATWSGVPRTTIAPSEGSGWMRAI